MTDSEIRNVIRDVRQKLPGALKADVRELIEREVWHVRLAFVPDGQVIDLGGGYSPVSAVLARLGMAVTVVDTFSSTKYYEQFSEAELREVLQKHDVTVVKQDLRDYDPRGHMPLNSVDRVISHGTLNFFNPRLLLERCVAVMKPGGMLVTDFENGVSLMRRSRVVRGRTNLDAFDAYFLDGSHKRFWTASELPALAMHLRLDDVQVIGRNWTVYQSRKSVPRAVLRMADRTLQAFPGLCNDLYLIGRKP
jgi:SAM-dependent methyltransferase